MTTSKPTEITPPRKAIKSQLTCHSRGGLVKKFKVNGEWKHISFGRWKFSSGGVERSATGSEIDEAIKRYQVELPYWSAGVEPPDDLDGVTILDVVTAFTKFKQGLVETGELRKSTFDDYRTIGQNLLGYFGAHRSTDSLSPLDWAGFRQAIMKRYSPMRVRKIIVCTRSIFNWAIESEIIERFKPGPSFRSPTAPKRLDVGRKRMFTPDEIHTLLDTIETLRESEKPRKPPRTVKGRAVERGVWRIEELNQLRAWILLGINCGFSAADCGWIDRARLDVDGTWDGDDWQGWDPAAWTGWHHYPRRKTERYNTPRSCPLWQETREALTACEFGQEFCFMTPAGHVCGEHHYPRHSFSTLLEVAGIHSLRMGYNWMRHTFRTAAAGCRDKQAVDFTMGHRTPDMSSVYIEGIDPQRLIDVVQHVHRWLF